MKKYFSGIALSIVFFSFTACKKSSNDPAPANPIAALNASWYVTNWGGVANNSFMFKIDQNLKTGVVQTVGVQPLGYTAGETILSNITATANAAVFTCNAVFKYGNNNSSTANTTGTLTLQTNNSQLLIHLSAAQGIQPPDYIYLKQ
jgi:hypothetical protein